MDDRFLCIFRHITPLNSPYVCPLPHGRGSDNTGGAHFSAHLVSVFLDSIVDVTHESHFVGFLLICYHIPTMPLEFNKTGDIADVVRMVDILLGDGGCLWDQEQTLETLPEYIRNESREVLDAIEARDWPHVREEIGDLLFICVFLCRIAEKEGRFTLKDAISGLIEKMIRRHPHVFGDTTVSSPDDVVANWNEIKKKERDYGK